MCDEKILSSLPSITGNHRMTWKELAEADDVASALTVDSSLGFATHKMTERKGSKIRTLIGCIAEMKRNEELSFLRHKENDFSVMYSSRKKCSQLWLGPAAYVNHDCQPNCEFTIYCDGDARMSLEAKKDIKKGDEIFIYYGKHFFDVNNCACECFTCELLGRGFFSRQHDLNQNRLSNATSNIDEKYKAIDHGHFVAPDSTVNGLPRSLTGKYSPTTSITDSVQRRSNTLVKGSSTGLARRSMPSSYSLRHTSSRLDRIKANLFKPQPRPNDWPDDRESPLSDSPPTSIECRINDGGAVSDSGSSGLGPSLPLSTNSNNNVDAGSPPLLNRANSSSDSLSTTIGPPSLTPDRLTAVMDHSTDDEYDQGKSWLKSSPTTSTWSGAPCLSKANDSALDSSGHTSPARQFEPILARLLCEAQSNSTDSLSSSSDRSSNEIAHNTPVKYYTSLNTRLESDNVSSNQLTSSGCLSSPTKRHLTTKDTKALVASPTSHTSTSLAKPLSTKRPSILRSTPLLSQPAPDAKAAKPCLVKHCPNGSSMRYVGSDHAYSAAPPPCKIQRRLDANESRERPPPLLYKSSPSPPLLRPVSPPQPSLRSYHAPPGSRLLLTIKRVSGCQFEISQSKG